jgi:uncharacterized protein (DUF302 family)
MAADGLVSIRRSTGGPKDTMNRIESEVKERAMTVFARVDHAASAAEVGLALRPTELLIIGQAARARPRIRDDDRRHGYCTSRDC